MGVLIWSIFCVWQFIAVQSSGLKLPLTSIACAPIATNPKSLSLSFSPKDRIDPKINEIEDINLKLTDTNLFSKDEKVKKTNSVLKLLAKLGKDNDTDFNIKDDVIPNQRNVDFNLLKEENSATIQNNLGNMKTAVDKKEFHEDEINKMNYSIKVLSPPTIFNDNVMNLPPNPNKYNLLPKSKKHPNSISQNSPVFWPSKSHEKRKPEFMPPKQKFNCNLHKGGQKNEIATKLNENIKIPRIEFPQKNNRERNENIDIVQNVKENPLESLENLQVNYGKPKEAVNVNTISLKKDSQSNDQFHSNNCDIKNIPLDAPLRSDLISDIINNQESTSLASPLYETSIDYKNINDDKIFLNSNNHKSISNSYSMPKNEYQKPLSFPSKPSYNLRQTPRTLYQDSNFSPSPEHIPSLRQPYNTDKIVNSNLSLSLDKLISFFTIKFLSSLSSVSATNSLEKTPDLEPNNIESTNLLPEFVPNKTKADKTGYLPTQDNSIEKDITSNLCSPSKSPVPYLSTVTINYIPCTESSNDIIIVM